MVNVYYPRRAQHRETYLQWQCMHAIGTLPLIQRLDGMAKQTWYADDSAAASRLEQLRSWWDLLNELGPLHGYFPNDAKTHILVKSQHIDKAKEIFKDTAISDIRGRKTIPMGGAMGAASFVQQFVQRKAEGS